ncbi:uncharacterized protein LOC108032337 [Drosophila biarmipes]|uniref:uncharacterized protein LOC108032337 n=1 Tax=Drosophila biarmipes TaxID=125945 RepID=UPI0021CC7898|nr:uncharacterized protein LOC108032337 [Drosophila biarmipes]
MRCGVIFLLSVLSLSCAAPQKSQREILSHFLRYVETIHGIQVHNSLVITVNFVQSIVDNVPVEHRGAGTSVLQNFANRGKNLRQRGTTAEKFAYINDIQGVFEGLKESFSVSAPESQQIGMSLVGLMAVASEFVKEDEKVHSSFTEGAYQMKTKLTPATIAQESELLNVINKYITSNDIKQHETLIEEVLKFKNRY